MSDKIVFSGIQPSGDFHLGNLIGAVGNWVKIQESGLNIFCIVDMHAITVDQDPGELMQKTKEVAALVLASGIDPQKSLLFVQSHNYYHANLAWVLNCVASMGQLNRMTQYKDKSEGKEFVSVGLFDYPVLMAADILLYGTTQVPVGVDQKQHVELARDLAEKFNSRYGETFVIPEPKIAKVGAKIMSLTDPTKKMSKSDPNSKSRIMVLDKADVVKKKINSAVTDSDDEVRYEPQGKPGVSNLIVIYSQCSGQAITEIEARFKNKTYGEFKMALGKVVNSYLHPIQSKYHMIMENDELLGVLKDGSKKAYEISHPKLVEVYKKVGFLKSFLKY